MGKTSIPVMRTGFTAEASARTGSRIAAVAAADAASNSLRLSTDSILLPGVLFHFRADSRAVRQMQVTLLDTEHLRCNRAENGPGTVLGKQCRRRRQHQSQAHQTPQSH